MGLIKRRLYKPDRLPPRARAWDPGPNAMFTEANLSLYEAEIGLAAVGFDSGVVVGRILGYDKRKNIFHVTGKRMVDNKAVDASIAGSRVSRAIISARILAGVSRLTREMSGR